MLRLAEVVKSKNEENEAFLSEIEVCVLLASVDWDLTLVQWWSSSNTSLIFLQTIGQAYDDMQTQNQHLLQQITERDDYNIKVNAIPSFTSN